MTRSLPVTGPLVQQAQGCLDQEGRGGGGGGRRAEKGEGVILHQEIN